jgi:ABC-type nitrate/sulfonate/bicarbonate transport system substrate-binding protein
MRNVILRLIAITLTATAIVSVGIPDRALGQGAPPLSVVNVVTTIADDVTPLLYAQRAGLFQKAGLDVHLQKLTSGSAATAAVFSGAYDIGKSSLVPLMSAHLRGLNSRLIAPGGMYDTGSPFALFLVEAHSAISRGQDLNGKIVSTPGLHDIGQLADSAWIDQHGGDSSTVHFVELPMSSSGTALEEHRIDASTILEPNLSAAMRAGKLRVLGQSFGAIAPHFLLSAWFAKPEWVKQNPTIANAFATVLAQAAAYTNAHQAETVPLASAFTGIPVSAYSSMTRGINGTDLRAADIQPVIDAAAKYHIIANDFSADELLK